MKLDRNEERLVAKTAASEKIPYLYKYSSFNEERLNDLITNERVHLSRPLAFNDPWDCRVWYSPNISNEASIEAHIRFYIRSTKAALPDLPDEVITERAQLLREDPERIREAIPHISRAMNDEIDMKYRVGCFSTHPDSELMWAHYGHSHSGVCLQFETNNPCFACALKVNYATKYTVSNLASEDIAEEISVLTTKSDRWAYEDEYRLVAMTEPHATSEGVPIVKDDFLPLPPVSLKSVIVGCRMPQEQRRQVSHIVGQAKYQVALKQAMPSDDEYRLLITPLNF